MMLNYSVAAGYHLLVSLEVACPLVRLDRCRFRYCSPWQAAHFLVAFQSSFDEQSRLSCSCAQ